MHVYEITYIFFNCIIGIITARDINNTAINTMAVDEQEIKIIEFQCINLPKPTIHSVQIEEESIHVCSNKRP